MFRLYLHLWVKCFYMRYDHPIMDSAVSGGLAIGTEAIRMLNTWLETGEIARAWYGKEDYTKFTTRLSFLPLNAFGSRTVSKVFTIKRDQWEQVIKACLPECGNWYQRRLDGECGWLPLYRAVRDSPSSGTFVEKARSSLSSIGTISSLPAARLDTWGLVVLGYADGGAPHIQLEGNGAYRATFHGRHFVLVIGQEKLNSTTVAHLTPLPYPITEVQQPNDAEWINLYRDGQSIMKDDKLLRWFRDPCQRLPNPPDGLVNGHMDDRIKRFMFDYRFAEILEKRIRNAIYDCYDEWMECKGKYPKDIFVQTQCQEVTDNLLKMRMFLGFPDRNSFCEEMTMADMLHYADKQYHSCCRHSEAHKNKRGQNTATETLLQHHRRILAFLKIWQLSKVVPKQLSTRNTGETLLLA